MHPIFLKLGFIEIRYYGLMYALALLIGIQLIFKEYKRRKIKYSEDDLLNIILGAFLGGLLFARIYYVLFNFSYYQNNLWEVFAVWHGGLAIHGGIFGGLLFGYFLTKHYKVNTWEFADIAAPYILLGQVFGRFGNFMNGDAHGVPTAMPWGVVFPLNTPAGMQFPGQAIHPTMLYELVLNLIFFFILHRLRLGRYKNGYIFCLYLIFYSIARFIVSFFRADDLMLGPFRTPHVVSVLLITFCCYLIKKYKLNKN